MDILSNVPALIFLVVVVAFFALVAVRLSLAFLVRRLAGLVFVLFGASFITFILGLLSPADAVSSQLDQKYTPEKAAILRHFYGLDLPWFQQYYNYIVRLFHFDLGPSWLDKGRNVWTILKDQLPASLQLGLSAAAIAIVVGVALGVVAAVRANTRYDTAVQGFGLIFYSLPTFVLIPLYQLLAISLYRSNIVQLPVASTDWYTNPEARIAPIAIFAIVQMAFYIRLTRTSILEVLRQDYVRTAKAKGLSDRTILWRHVFRNGMIPIITAVGPALAFIVNGAFITEALFNIPGIGTTTLAAISQGDIPVVQATVILLAVAVALMNLVTDVAYGFIDPRIKTA